jgi:D-aminoacyl-tRNA deacylase
VSWSGGTLPWRLIAARKDVHVRAVVSRVDTAAVTVDDVVVGEIGRGLLSLVGVGREDDVRSAHALARKIHELRIFPTEDGARSAADLALPILVVSQFTLYADTRKGRRPSWEPAAPAEDAEPLVEELVAELRRRGCAVATGSFGARMSVSSVNDGPMTLLLEV